MTAILRVELTFDWQPTVALPVGSVEDPTQRIEHLGELSQFATRLNEPTKRMSLCFDRQPPDGNVHIIVKRPVIGTCF